MPIRVQRDGSSPWWAHQPWGRRKPRPHSPLDRLRVRPARLEIRALFLRDFCGALLRPPIRSKARVLDVRRTRPCDGRVRARIEATARPPEPAPPSCAARPRACGPGDPRAFARGHPNRARGERQRLCSCRRNPRAHRGSRARHPRGQCALPDRDDGRSLPRVLLGGCRRGRPEGRCRGHERDQYSGRFRRSERLSAG